MRTLFYLIATLIGLFLILFIDGYQTTQRENKNKESYNSGYINGEKEGYKEGACGIVRSITGRKNCEIKEIRTASGKTIRAAISLPE